MRTNTLYRPVKMLDLKLYALNPVGGMRSINSTDRLHGRPADKKLTREEIAEIETFFGKKPSEIEEWRK